MWSRRIPRLQEPNAWTRALERRRAAGAPLLDLAEANPTRVGLGGAAGAALTALADPRAAHYEPDARGLEVARVAVSEYYTSRGARVPAGAVVLTAGTSEACAHLLRLLADPGDALLAPAPGYPLFEPIAALEGVTLVPYRIAWDGAWHLDRGSIERGLEVRPRGIIVVEPNVPTGCCLASDDRGWLETRCAERGIALIADEVFADFPWPAAGLPIPGFAGRDAALTFALGGISKVCGLPQLKLSWIAVSGPEATRREALGGLEWISDLFLSVASPVQLALPALLGAKEDYQARVRERLARNLARLGALERRAPEACALPGAGGWSVVLRLPARRTGEQWALALLDRDVVAHPGDFYDLEGEAYLVVSLIPEPAVFDAGLARLEDLIAGG